MGHPLDEVATFAGKYSYASAGIRYATFFTLLLAFSITAGAPPSDGQTYANFAGLVGQLTCAILCWIYLLFVVGSHVLATNGSGNNIFQELPATIRFASDLTFTMVCFIGSISGAAAIHTDCILPPSILPAEACFACPQSDQLDPTVTDPECKLEGGTPDGPYMCAKKCKNAFRFTIVTSGNGGTFGFLSFLMFISTLLLLFSTILSFKDVRSGSDGGFEDVGDTYGPITGGYGDSAENGKGGGVSYETDDALPAASSHDL